MAAWSDHDPWRKPARAVSTPRKLKSFEREWDLFTDEALIKLLADASTELGRRGKNIQVSSSHGKNLRVTA